MGCLKRHILFCFLILSFPMMLYGQKVKKVSGEYVFHVPETMSIEQAKAVALERAKIQILADTFGTAVDASSASVVTNSSGTSDIAFQSFSETMVKGEWVEMLGAPEYSVLYENGQLVVKVTVSGKVRELVSPKISVDAKILRNGPDDVFEQSDFLEGDDMYLSFRAPVAGFLTVYMFDGVDTVYRLLPYGCQSVPSVTVSEGKRYLFFSASESEICSSDLVDEYVLTCSKEMEINRIYVIFSPNKFVKAIDGASGDGTLPRMLNIKDFQKWLSGCRMADSELVVVIRNIIVRK